LCKSLTIYKKEIGISFLRRLKFPRFVKRDERFDIGLLSSAMTGLQVGSQFFDTTNGLWINILRIRIFNEIFVIFLRAIRILLLKDGVLKNTLD